MCCLDNIICLDVFAQPGSVPDLPRAFFLIASNSGSVRFRTFRKFIGSVRFGSKIHFPGSMRFGLFFLFAAWLGPVRFGSVRSRVRFRLVPEFNDSVRLGRFGSVSYSFLVDYNLTLVVLHYIHACVCICIYIYIYMCVYIYIYIYMYSLTFRRPVHAVSWAPAASFSDRPLGPPPLSQAKHVYIYIYMYYIYIYIHYIYMYVYVLCIIHVYVYIYIYIYIYIYEPSK